MLQNKKFRKNTWCCIDPSCNEISCYSAPSSAAEVYLKCIWEKKNLELRIIIQIIEFFLFVLLVLFVFLACFVFFVFLACFLFVLFLFVLFLFLHLHFY